MKKRSLIIFLLALAALGVGTYAAWRAWDGAADAPRFKLAKVESGPLTAAVSATGTLNPVVSVQVGSQVSGQIKEILVDFNSPVKSGQLIARLDPETYEHRVRQAQADVDAARAGQGVQQAEVARARANLSNAQRDYERKKTLVEKNFISPAERDTAQNTLDAARASLAAAEAQVKNGEAVVRQREAQLAAARVDLERTSIKAPVDGIVVKRSIEPGQTVAASLQAPELFVIAKNLTDMQVETSIDEADVGRVRFGQKASFTVDAFAGRHFEGEVRQVRKAATVVSNVVTYTVVISAANPDLILLPGMTANVRIITAQKDKALKVPNATLRFRPAAAANERKATTAGAVSPAPTSAAAASSSGRIWIVDADGKAKPVEVRLGLTDGSMTEIVSGDIKEGQEVIAGQQAATKASGPGPRLF
ncbi:MAG: efflux RND transporter periplasmic adaptor subunit [Sulfuritalea sp.]|nr:efflux RND transporter periplasmic adaptor subunit [Sulfuritalea sp.]